MHKKFFLLISLVLIAAVAASGCGRGEAPQKRQKSGFSEVAPGNIVYIKSDKAYAIKTDGAVDHTVELSGIKGNKVIQTVLLSGDGKRLAYNYGSKPGKKRTTEFAVINMSSGDKIAIMNREKTGQNSPVIASDNAWSPDDNSIILHQDYNLGIMDVNVGYKDLGLMMTGDIAWSPDGQNIVLSGMVNRFLQIYNTKTSEIVNSPTNKARLFVFSSNDRFLSIKGGESPGLPGMDWIICRMDFSGENFEELTNIQLKSGKSKKNLPIYESLKISANGSKVMFIGGGGLYDGYYICVLDSDGENLKRLVKLKDKKRSRKPDTWFRRSAFLSPDGDWVVYSENDGIYAIKVETGQKERIVKGKNLMLAGWSE